MTTEPQLETPTPAVDLPAEEFFDTLTGFDELAIKRAFGSLPSTLAGTEPTTWIRSLVFVNLRRAEGLKDAEAYSRAMGMSLGEAGDYFADSEGGDPVANLEADSEGNGDDAEKPTT